MTSGRCEARPRAQRPPAGIELKSRLWHRALAIGRAFPLLRFPAAPPRARRSADAARDASRHAGRRYARRYARWLGTRRRRPTGLGIRTRDGGPRAPPPSAMKDDLPCSDHVKGAWVLEPRGRAKRRSGSTARPYGSATVPYRTVPYRQARARRVAES